VVRIGLGKTVVSLSLVLVNPAPVLPVSGSPVSSLNTLKGSSNARWDKLLFARTSVDNKKRGSILSRGTLVICHVSLVGQWIEEARSKLKDPGLLYSYHGSGRKRDPFKLARNAIVVTTCKPYGLPFLTLLSAVDSHLLAPSHNPRKSCRRDISIRCNVSCSKVQFCEILPSTRANSVVEDCV